MEFVSQKQKNRDARLLVRRVQRDWMMNKFRESDKLGGTPVSASDKPIAASVMQADIRLDKSIETAMEHVISVIYGKRAEYHAPDTIDCGVCGDAVYPQYTRTINKIITCRKCDVMNTNNISMQLKMGDWSYYGA